MDEEVFRDLESLIKENSDVIYSSEELNKPYNEIIRPLMKKLYERLICDVEMRNFDSPVFRATGKTAIQKARLSRIRMRSSRILLPV